MSAAVAALLSAAGLVACVDASAGRDAFVFPEPDTATTDTGAADTGDVTDTEDDADDAPLDTSSGPSLPPESASLATIWSGDARWASPLTAGVTLIVAADGAWWWLDAAGPRAVLGDGELTVPDVPPAGVATLPDGTILVAVDGTLLRLVDGVLGETPLAAALAGQAIADLCATPGGAVWFGTDQGLWRWRGDTLVAITPGSLPRASARLACGASVDGRSAVWVAAGGQVYAVTEGDDGLLLWPEQPELDATALGADHAGDLWVVDIAGGVVRRTPGAIWSAVALPEPVVALAARPSSPHVWLRGERGRLFHAVGDALSEVTNAPPGALAAPPEADGAALVPGATGVIQVAPGRVVAILGVNPGATLSEAQTLTIRASEPGDVEQLSVTLDDVVVDATAVGAGDARVWQIAIDPPALANGEHRVDVAVTWADATLTTALRFRVAFPTWAHTIEPLYQKRCSACHDAVIGAATAVLDEMSAWTAQIDCIICRVSAPFDPALPECMMCASAPSSMPPTGALPDHEIDRVRDWRAGGLRP